MSTLRTVVIFAAALTLTACATTADRSAARVAPQRSGTMDTHHQYVAQVEAVARRRGIDVKWINMPVKRTKRDD
jgi:outer membrane biogenesis lipoprotein LolB